MDRRLAIRLSLIIIVAGIALYLLYPTYRYFTRYRNLTEAEIAQLPEAERRELRDILGKSMKLGLDLQGGMHLVLEMDESKLGNQDRSDAQDRVMQILSTRVDQFGVAEPTIAKQGDTRILIQLPGVEDPERAKNLVQGLAQLEFRMALEPDEVARIVQDIDEALAAAAKADTTGTTDASGTGSDAAGSGSTADDAAVAGADTAAADSAIIPELLKESPTTPEVSEERPFSSHFIGFQLGALIAADDGYHVQRVNELLEREEVRAVLKKARAQFFWSSEDFGRTQDGLPTKVAYFLRDKVELTGNALKDARVSPDPNAPSAMLVNFRLDRKGARIFSRLTADNIGKRLAIVLDGVVKSAPTIQGRIPTGDGQITGGFSDQQAKDLAIVLRAGALPVDLKIVEERTVGPTLGADSLRKGLTASLVGLGVTILFLLVYYQFAGLLASIALIMNLILVLAAMSVLRAALSLPGIAGLVLSVAMAVDANVLIFERIREEILKKKTVNAAIEAGYKNALSAIIDSNLTTMFAGIILLYFGTGPIKGFAVTLCIGITASMFTALFVTRFFFDLATYRRRLEKLRI